MLDLRKTEIVGVRFTPCCATADFEVPLSLKCNYRSFAQVFCKHKFKLSRNISRTSCSMSNFVQKGGGVST